MSYTNSLYMINFEEALTAKNVTYNQGLEIGEFQLVSEKSGTSWNVNPVPSAFEYTQGAHC